MKKYKLATALIDMLEQHAGTNEDNQLFHDGLSANENAINILVEIGVVNVKKDRYFVNIEKLEELKNNE